MSQGLKRSPKDVERQKYRLRPSMTGQKHRAFRLNSPGDYFRQIPSKLRHGHVPRLAPKRLE